MIDLSYNKELIGDDGDLSPGALIPAEILGHSISRAFFLFHRIAQCRIENPPYLYAAIRTLSPSDPVNDLIRRIFAARHPDHSALLFPNSSGDVYNAAAIRDSLKNIQTLGFATANSENAKLWVLCCRAAADVNVHEAKDARAWMDGFANQLSDGRPLDAPNKHQEFEIALRWGASALPAWSESQLVNGRTKVHLSQIGQVEFLRGWSHGVDTDHAWRAVAWLATVVGGTWHNLLADVVGVSLTTPRDAVPLELSAPHGADHLVALVGASGSGKTSYLCALATDSTNFEYQRIQDDRVNWIRSSYEEAPQSLWGKNQDFATQLGEHLERRGSETSLRDGIRLIAYDVSGKLLGDPSTTIAGFGEFLQRFPPSGLILIVGENPRDSARVASNLQQVVHKLSTGSSHAHRIPIKVLFNFSDRRFASESDLRRETLLGMSPLACDVSALTSALPSSRSRVDQLLGAIRAARYWATHPHEAAAYERVIVEFRETLDILMSEFDALVLAFVSCASGHNDLRRSAGALWKALHDEIAIASRSATHIALSDRFMLSVERAADDLKAVRVLGERLSALSLPNIEIDKDADNRVRIDWEGLRTTDRFDEFIVDIQSGFENLVKGLPSSDFWQIYETECKPQVNPSSWLLASLGVPVAQSLRDIVSSESGTESISAAAKWTDFDPTQAHPKWEGALVFDCRWDVGAKTIPCELTEGLGRTVVNDVRKNKGFLEGKPVADLLGRCLQDKDKEALGKLIRALTNARKDRGIFPEQSLERGDPDVYAYAAVGRGEPRFGQFRSTALCQQWIADALWDAAELALSTQANDQTAPSRINVSKILTLAYFLRLLRVGKGNVLQNRDLDVGLLKRVFGTDPFTRLTSEIHKTSSGSGSDVTVSKWLENPGDQVHKLLNAAVAFGDRLIRIADERLAALLHAKLAYAIASGWFPGADSATSALVRRLEDVNHRANDAWAVYQGAPESKAIAEVPLDTSYVQIVSAHLSSAERPTQ